MIKLLRQKLIEDTSEEKSGDWIIDITLHHRYLFFKVNNKTFHGAGMVVPVDKNEVGYREVPETQGN